MQGQNNIHFVSGSQSGETTELAYAQQNVISLFW